MTVYFAIFLVLTAAVLAGFGRRDAWPNRSLYGLATALMIACAGLRAASVGRDYVTYRDYYALSPDTIGPGFIAQWSATMPFVDAAYVYFNSLMKKAGFSFEAVVLLIALLVVTLYAALFWRHARFAAVALMVYFSHAFLNKEMIQMRSGIASVFCLWAFHFWAARRRRSAIAVMVLAVLTHMASAVAVIPLLIFDRKWILKPWYVAATVVVAIVVGYSLSSDFSFFYLLDRLALFQDTEYSAPVGIFSNLVTIKQLLLLGLCCWLVSIRRESFPPLALLCLTSYWVATLWIIAFNQFEILGARGASFLWIGEPLILAQVLFAFYRQGFLRPYRRLAACAVVCFALSTLLLDLNKKEVFDDYTTVLAQ